MNCKNQKENKTSKTQIKKDKTRIDNKTTNKKMAKIDSLF